MLPTPFKARRRFDGASGASSPSPVPAAVPAAASGGSGPSPAPAPPPVFLLPRVNLKPPAWKRGGPMLRLGGRPPAGEVIGPGIRSRGANRRAVRDAVEYVLDMALHLPRPERDLVQQVLVYQMTIAQLARLHQLSYAVMHRRFTRLLRRLRSPRFAFTALYLDHLPRDVRETARLAILHGLPIRRTAAITRQSLHTVRLHLQMVRNLSGL